MHGRRHACVIKSTSKSVSVSIGVGEEPSLQHLILRRFNPGNEMAGREGCLLDLLKIIGGIAI